MPTDADRPTFSPADTPDDAVPSRRKILVIGEGFLPVLMGSGEHRYEVFKDALPMDAVIVGAEFDPFGHRLRLLVESESFEATMPGCQYPSLTPMFRTIPVDDPR